MKNFKITGLIALLALTAVSCNRDEADSIIPAEKHENGILVANEGKFGTPNAELSYISRGFSSIKNDIYKTTNGENLGDVLQHVNFHNGEAYLVMNNSNKIIVTDRYTFQKKAEITQDVKNPRYITFVGNQAYVTNSTYGGEQSVTIYNTENYNLIKKIPSSDTVERIVTAGTNVFVQNAGFGTGNKLTIISSSSNNVTGTITIPNGAINKTISYNDEVYVIAGKATEPDSHIYKYNSSGSLSNTITLTGIKNANNIEIDNGYIYFTVGTGVYSMELSSNTAPSSPIFSVAENGYSTLYGFNVIDGLIYISDANGFTQASKVSIHTPSGTILKTFLSGIGTNAFYKN